MYNCIGGTAEISAGDYIGAGIHGWITLSGEVCDCDCKGDWQGAAGLSTGVEIGFGLGGHVTIAGFKITEPFEITGPQVGTEIGWIEVSRDCEGKVSVNTSRWVSQLDFKIQGAIGGGFALTGYLGVKASWGFSGVTISRTSASAGGHITFEANFVVTASLAFGNVYYKKKLGSATYGWHIISYFS